MIEISVYYPVGRIIGEPSAEKVRIEFILPKRPFLFWSAYEVAEKIQFPRGYGIAYKDPERARVLFAPMPFNLMVGLVIWAYQWLRIGFARWCYRHKPIEVEK
jgi:hypothetical protein